MVPDPDRRFEGLVQVAMQCSKRYSNEYGPCQCGQVRQSACVRTFEAKARPAGLLSMRPAAGPAPWYPLVMLLNCPPPYCRKPSVPPSSALINLASARLYLSPAATSSSR